MESKKIHPLIPEAREQLRQGKISRRDFLRFSTLLGMSLASARVLAACAPATTEAPQPTAVAQATIKRGGTLKAATRVEKVDHPARFSLVSQSHPWRHVFEYLTLLDEGGVPQPLLLDSWSVSDDLLTWTLKLKQGIKFSNGQDFTADDVIFNISQWLSDTVGASLKADLSFLDPNGQEKIDDYTVVCHAAAPSIYLAHRFAQYPACIVPKTFGGDINLEPIGTGPFTVAEYVPAERCRLVARKDYWQKGEDGQPLPYLDEIIMVQLGEDRSADQAALQTGQVDMILEPNGSMWEALKDDPKFNIVPIATAATRVLRVRVDQDPWKDNKVRQALKHCHNREKILAVALLGQGVIGNDSHVSPSQPEYVDIAPYPFDTAKSKALLAEAGHADGLDVELTVASDWPESMAYAQALKEDAAAGGFNITLKTMPASDYWNGWTEWNMGITWWSDRPSAPMVLASCYVADADGKPVAWNESYWVDQEFSDILTQAQATIDLAKRKELVGKLEVIQKERGSICTPFFMNVWQIYTKQVHGIQKSNQEYAILYKAWRE